ncbi:MAG: hypothetical protein N2V78_09115 [Methanophagales archaeon]|nr:hypothetical protein [Methanophagales archaeon]
MRKEKAKGIIWVCLKCIIFFVVSILFMLGFILICWLIAGERADVEVLLLGGIAGVFVVIFLNSFLQITNDIEMSLKKQKLCYFVSYAKSEEQKILNTMVVGDIGKWIKNKEKVNIISFNRVIIEKGDMYEDEEGNVKVVK